LEFNYADKSPDAIGNQSRNGKNLIIHTNSVFNSGFDQETSKDRSYTDSGMDLGMRYKEKLEARIREAQQ
jgi:hypothetical protein